jgi:hypothetical protein
MMTTDELVRRVRLLINEADEDETVSLISEDARSFDKNIKLLLPRCKPRDLGEDPEEEGENDHNDQHVEKVGELKHVRADPVIDRERRDGCSGKRDDIRDDEENVAQAVIGHCPEAEENSQAEQRDEQDP